MKKQITLLILLFFNCMFALSQGRYIKTTTPCNNDLILKTPGRWFKARENDYGGAKVTSQQRQEFMKRLTTIHQLIYDLYPSPTAVDAQPFYFTTDKYFASQLKVERSSNDRTPGTDVNGIPVIYYSYSAMFCGYHCTSDASEMMRGQGCEAGTNILIGINGLDAIFMPLWLDDYAEILRVDGRPIKMLSRIVGQWKGYDVYNPDGVEDPKMVLLHREGMLPYIPVTRKQYLNRNIECLQIFFDKIIKSFEHPVGLAAMQDKKDLDEQIKKQQQQRDDVIKYYKDELDATIKAGLLEAPAILSEGIMDITTTHPVFTTQAAGGKMLVTENPAYIRQDLPKYIPQLIIYRLSDGPGYFVDQSLNPYKLIDDNFPIEKLKAMIDK